MYSLMSSPLHRFLTQNIYIFPHKKTSSGKLRRAATRKAYEDGSFCTRIIGEYNKEHGITFHLKPNNFFSNTKQSSSSSFTSPLSAAVTGKSEDSGVRVRNKSSDRSAGDSAVVPLCEQEIQRKLIDLVLEG